MLIRSIAERLMERVPENALARLRKFAPLGFFTGGFTWDSLTLTRVDNLLDNAILLGYLILLGLSIVLMYLAGADRLSPRLGRMRGWYPNMIQFFMGGLFSSYVVFYFHSASMSRTLLFVLLLAGLLVANEFLKDSLRNVYLTMGLYFFVSFAFFTFSIPVVLRKMNYATFFLSGIVSLMLVSGMAYLLYRTLVLRGKRQMWAIIVQSVMILLFLNILYKVNWIPPVPLSVKWSGIYRMVERTGDSYELTYASPGWRGLWRTSETVFKHREGDRVYCFTSIFAPADLKKEIYHHWSIYSPEKRQWTETDRLGFNITGGRGQGWRGYTNKQNVSPGRWKVEIKTGDGLLLGQTIFRIVESSGELELVTKSI